MTSVGVEIGDDRITAVVVDAAGGVSSRSTEAARASDRAAAVRAAYRKVQAGIETPAAFGVTMPFQSDGIPQDIVRVLSEESGTTPVAVNAGHAILLAETWCGAAKNQRDVVAIAIREHVTAGIMIGGNVVTGAHGYAGSVAWLVVNPVEREDYRRHGGLEAEVAAAGVVRRLVWRIKSGDQSQVVERAGGDLARVTLEDIIAAARHGDGVCLSVVRDTAKYVGIAVANLATTIDPDCVVLGGTLAASGDLMLDVVRAECARRLRPGQHDAVRIVLSELGDDAAAIGAARAALLQHQ
jgi:glucokinase